MWKDSNRNIVVIFQPTILRSVGFYVRHSAIDAALNSIFHNLEFISQHVHFLDAKIGAANRKTTGKKP